MTMILLRIAFIVLVTAIGINSAHAQAYRIVPSCSTASLSPSQGSQQGFMDINGNICTSSSGGSGSTVTVSGAASTIHDCGGSITTGGTAQQIISSAQYLHGFLLEVGVNDSNTDPIYFSDTTTTPGAGVAGSLSLNPSTTTAAGGSFSTPLNYPTGSAIYANGATTGDKFKCRYW